MSERNRYRVRIEILLQAPSERSAKIIVDNAFVKRGVHDNRVIAVQYIDVEAQSVFGDAARPSSPEGQQP
jgi:hypothetical protein